MLFFSKIDQWVLGQSVSIKVTVLLFLTLITVPLGILIQSQSSSPDELANFLVIFLTVAVICFVPLSRLFSRMLAQKHLEDLNAQCLRLKEGNYKLEDLPEGRSSKDDFQALQRNLHWMGHAIASREKKLSSTLDELAVSQKHVMESIEYGSLIQRAFLPDGEMLDALFHDSFLIWDQRDTVGGDFYWMKQVKGGFYVGVMDCTGHGVPGAFMTLIIQSLFDSALEQAELAQRGESPAAVLSELNRLIKKALGQTDRNSVSDDGMDCSLCFIPTEQTYVLFAGARNPLFVLSEGKVVEIKGDRCGVGYVRSPMDYEFKDQIVKVCEGMRFYLFSDGITDQVGGEKRFPFGKKKFKQFIVDWRDRPINEQKEPLFTMVEEFRGAEERRDDMTILGFELETLHSCNDNQNADL
ncbi:MAG: SpoIIE family protein phosphatase [Desulfovibrio sp.]